MMHTILKYLPYVLLFAVATMIVYGWGLWRTMRQGSDLANMLSSKGISKVKKTLKKNGPMINLAKRGLVDSLMCSPLPVRQLALGQHGAFLI